MIILSLFKLHHCTVLTSVIVLLGAGPSLAQNDRDFWRNIFGSETSNSGGNLSGSSASRNDGEDRGRLPQTAHYPLIDASTLQATDAAFLSRVEPGLDNGNFSQNIANARGNAAGRWDENCLLADNLQVWDLQCLGRSISLIKYPG